MPNDNTSQQGVAVALAAAGIGQEVYRLPEYTIPLPGGGSCTCN